VKPELWESNAKRGRKRRFKPFSLNDDDEPEHLSVEEIFAGKTLSTETVTNPQGQNYQVNFCGEGSFHHDILLEEDIPQIVQAYRLLPKEE
jgi:hypothetical protein